TGSGAEGSGINSKTPPHQQISRHKYPSRNECVMNLVLVSLSSMESEDYGRGGWKHHCHHHDRPHRKEQPGTHHHGRRGHRRMHGVVVVPKKYRPSCCRERQKQTQYDVALKREWIWLGFVHRRISNIAIEAKDHFNFARPLATNCPSHNG